MPLGPPASESGNLEAGEGACRGAAKGWCVAAHLNIQQSHLITTLGQTLMFRGAGQGKLDRGVASDLDLGG